MLPDGIHTLAHGHHKVREDQCEDEHNQTTQDSDILFEDDSNDLRNTIVLSHKDCKSQAIRALLSREALDVCDDDVPHRKRIRLISDDSDV